jgi:hypothetical protein
MNLTHLDASKIALHDVIADHMAPPVGRPSHLQSLMIGRSSYNHRYSTADNYLNDKLIMDIRSYLERYFKIDTNNAAHQPYKISQTLQFEGGNISTFFFYVKKIVNAGVAELTPSDIFESFEMIVFGSVRNNAFSITTCDPFFKEKHHGFFQGYLAPKSHTVTIIDLKGAEQSVTVSGDKIRTHDNFYPYLGCSVKELVDEYYASNSSVLILTGPAGTGKSSLMRSFLNYAPVDMNFYMVDNPVMYEDPESFSGLIQKIRNQAINGPVTVFMEEADKLLVADKKTDMGSMARLLSVTSGLVELNIKLVLASNLENASKINENLIRHGRTFRVVEFEHLSPAQANAARTSVGKGPLDFAHDITLAHALNTTEANVAITRRQAGFGFTGKA